MSVSALPSSRLRSLLGAVLLVVALVAGGWLWLGPRANLSLPGPAASPVAVVRTYVTALDERDFAVSNALQPYGSDSHWWSFEPPTVRNLSITGVHIYRHGQSARWRQTAYVSTTAVFADWSGMRDGRAGWGYYLARNSDTRPWRIVDWGQG